MTERTYRVGYELPNLAGGFRCRDMNEQEIVQHIADMTRGYGEPCDVLNKWHVLDGRPVACFTFHKGFVDEQRLSVHGLLTIDCR